MDRYAVLVFRDQDITDDQQMAFTLNFGEIENADGGNITKADEKRLKQGMIDVSNLDKDGKPLARDDRRRMFNLGNRLWHSDSSFRAKPGEIFAPVGAHGREPGRQYRVRRHARRLRHARRRDASAMIEDLVCEHSLIYSRGSLGFTELTEDEKAMFEAGAPAPGAHASGDRAQVALPVLARRHDRRLAGARGARLPARPDRARDAARVRLRRTTGGSTTS